jgi:hypothetical protein
MHLAIIHQAEPLKTRDDIGSHARDGHGFNAAWNCAVEDCLTGSALKSEFKGTRGGVERGSTSSVKCQQSVPVQSCFSGGVEALQSN